MSDNVTRSCIDCGIINCDSMDKKYPQFCVTENLKEEVLKAAMEEYKDEINNKVAVASAEIEADYYCTKTRVEEIILFAKKMNVKKIGIATCVGLITEARIAAKIFRSHGFEVYGVGCKTGTQPKTSIGIPQRCEAVGKNMCNPILQAMILNEANTDLNVVIGLCVGHDSLFYKYAKGLTTTLVTKDRVMGHNPVAALYQADKYYKKKLFDN